MFIITYLLLVLISFFQYLSVLWMHLLLDLMHQKLDDELIQQMSLVEVYELQALKYILVKINLFKEGNLKWIGCK